MLRTPHFRQGLRHDVLGVVVIAELLEPWLDQLWKRYPSWLKVAVLCAVGGHHLKFPDQAQRKHSKNEIVFLGNHSQMGGLLSIGQAYLDLNGLPKLRDMTYSLLPFGGINENLYRIRRLFDLEFSPQQKLFIAVIHAPLGHPEA